MSESINEDEMTATTQSHNSFMTNSAISEDEKQVIIKYIDELKYSDKRDNALVELSRQREHFSELAPFIWHSVGTIAALLQEIVSVYPQLSPPNLDSRTSNKACNVLALLQCVASHKETRQLFLKAHIPLFLYPFLNTVSRGRPFEYLRLTSLGVIGALVKMDDTEVINFLLQTEIIPLCLRIMERGTELSQTVATFIIQKILLDDQGLNYLCQTAERFFAVSTVLNNMVINQKEKASSRLLKHIIRCYNRLSENPRALIALQENMPCIVTNQKLMSEIDESSRRQLKMFADQLSSKSGQQLTQQQNQQQILNQKNLSQQTTETSENNRDNNDTSHYNNFNNAFVNNQQNISMFSFPSKTPNNEANYLQQNQSNLQQSNQNQNHILQSQNQQQFIQQPVQQIQQPQSQPISYQQQFYNYQQQMLNRQQSDMGQQQRIQQQQILMQMNTNQIPYRMGSVGVGSPPPPQGSFTPSGQQFYSNTPQIIPQQNMQLQGTNPQLFMPQPQHFNQMTSPLPQSLNFQAIQNQQFLPSMSPSNGFVFQQQYNFQQPFQ